MQKKGNQRYKAEVWDIMQYMFSDFNDHQVHFVIRLDGHINEERLKRATELSSASLPLIKCRFVDAGGRPYWEDAGFCGKDMVRVVSVSEDDDALNNMLILKTDTFRGPQLSITIIRKAVSDTLCVIINHMLTDGAGFKEYLYLLASIYTGLSDDPKYLPDCSFGSRSSWQVLHKFSFKDKLKILFSRYDVSKQDSGLCIELEGEPESPFIVTHTIEKERFRQIIAYSRERGATVNDTVLAAYLRVLKGSFGRTAVIPCVIDMRKYLPGKKAGAICNLTSNLICDIGSDIGENFDDTLLKVKCNMDAQKSSYCCLNAIMMLEIAFASLPYKKAKAIVSVAFKNPAIAMTNIGVIDKNQLVFGKLLTVGASLIASVKYKPYFQIALSTFDSEATFSVNLHGTQRDKEKISEFLCLLDGELPCKIN